MFDALSATSFDFTLAVMVPSSMFSPADLPVMDRHPATSEVSIITIAIVLNARVIACSPYILVVAVCAVAEDRDSGDTSLIPMARLLYGNGLRPILRQVPC